MAEIRPFAGLRYNQSIVNDISSTICPPYDVISLSLHQDLLKRNEFNFIRLEDADTSPADNAANNKYTRTAETLALWLDTKVLVPEKHRLSTSTTTISIARERRHAAGHHRARPVWKNGIK